MKFYSKKVKQFEICRHKSSGKLFFVKYVRKNDNFENEANEKNVETNLWLWKLFDNPVGGVFVGGAIEIIAKRFSFNWFLLAPKLLLRMFNNYFCRKIRRATFLIRRFILIRF